MSNSSDAWHRRSTGGSEMFDKLIVSEPDRGEVNHRRNYFLVSTVVVGVLFITGVVISIYAADIDLGTSSFEMAELVSPLDLAPPDPEPARPTQPNTASHTDSDVPMRRDNMRNMAETPIEPTTISTTQNTAMERPLGTRFDVGPRDTNPASSGGRSVNGGTPASDGIGTSRVEPVQPEDTTPPPARVEPAKPRPPVSKGVINGIAKDLPKPEYSAAARAMGAQGKVDIQVTIDESGRVISAHAINGNVLLRPAAENAARRARFSPTILSETPVKVTGIIVYNFIR